MKFRIVLVLTTMAVGRAMTLPYISRAGDGGAGDPPKAWLMPLLGDAAIGLTAIAVVWLLVAHRTVGVWAGAVVFHFIAAFDAVAAFVIDVSVPWSGFFMLETFGRAMFFAAAAMHLFAAALLASTELRQRFGVATPVAVSV